MSEPPQCANKKKRRRTNSSGGHTSSNSWLVRLSEACAKHKEYHRLHDNENDDDDTTNNNNHNHNKTEGSVVVSEKCRKDLGTLRKILPEVEKKYTISLLNLVSAQDISHMCAFYRIVVMGGFCQHSMCLLRDAKNNTSEQQSKFHFKLHILLHHYMLKKF